VLEIIAAGMRFVARWEEELAPQTVAAFKASLALPEVCRKCEFLDSCGGGHLAQRWSTERQYDNPSVYCESWKAIFSHIWKRIAPTFVVDLEPVSARQDN